MRDSSALKRKADPSDANSHERACAYAASLLRTQLDAALAVIAEHELFSSEKFCERAMLCLTNGRTSADAVQRCVAVGMNITPRIAHRTLHNKLATWVRQPASRLSLDLVDMLLARCEPDTLWGVNLLAQACRYRVADPVLVARMEAHCDNRCCWASESTLVTDLNERLVGRRLFVGEREVTAELPDLFYRLSSSAGVADKLEFLFRHTAVLGLGFDWLARWCHAGLLTTSIATWLGEEAVPLLGREILTQAVLDILDGALQQYEAQPDKSIGIMHALKLRADIRALLDQ